MSQPEGASLPTTSSHHCNSQLHSLSANTFGFCQTPSNLEDRISQRRAANLARYMSSTLTSNVSVHSDHMTQDTKYQAYLQRELLFAIYLNLSRNISPQADYPTIYSNSESLDSNLDPSSTTQTTIHAMTPLPSRKLTNNFRPIVLILSPQTG